MSKSNQQDTQSSSDPKMSSLEKNLFGVPIRDVGRLLPGLILAASIAWLSLCLKDFIGITLLGLAVNPISPTIIALLIGMAIGNMFQLHERFTLGIAFVIKKMLRLGIIFLGIRLSFFSVLQLGFLGIPVVLTCIIGGLFFTTLLNRWLNQPSRLGVLIAVGTSICGASAILAMGPAIKAKDEEVSYAVSVITLFGLIAMIFYPTIAYIVFSGDPLLAGLFLGTAVHETAQVAGAALIFSDLFSLPSAIDAATITKLVRNIFMAVVIPLMAFYYMKGAQNSQSGTHQPTQTRQLIPLFILGFVAFSIIRSLGDFGILSTNVAFGLFPSAVWTNLVLQIKTWASNLLVLALAGVGLCTRFSRFKGLGVKPCFVGFGAAFSVGILSYLAITLLGSFIII
ncbi:MAG: YeiH family protein [Candidatus Ranarchaeia archaeon]|jgi:uncharacterized integral membrane protein (TIGR00698 family)